MSESDDDLLGKADALIRRHRVFLAGGQVPAPLEEELPLLTDVVDAAQFAPPPEAPPPPPGPSPQALEQAARARLDALLDALQPELKRSMEQWMEELLPRLLARELHEAADRMLAEIGQRFEADMLPRLAQTLADARQAALADSADPDHPSPQG